jgi:hypothetical protein
VIRRSFVLWFVVSAAACGGKVRFEGSGAGANGEGAGASQSACEVYCEVLVGCPDIPPDCVGACEEGRASFPSDCLEEFDDLIRCYAEEDVCLPTGSECVSENVAIASCFEQGFGGFAGGFADDGSSSSGFGGFSP